MKKALIAMSGGVDSAAAAAICVDKGYECQGVTLRLILTENGEYPEEEDAAHICEQLKIAHRVIDMHEDFCKSVVNPFIQEYEKGLTPNPCIECNRNIKFGRLYDYAVENGFDLLVTGHYARIEQGADGALHVFKAIDDGKDQSYVLYNLKQEMLEHLFFPLGYMTKESARSIAVEKKLLCARKKDSQDICFVPDGDYAEYIRTHSDREYPEGDFTDSCGRVLGRHKGIIRYTIGQRKGLGLALPEPLYVCEKDVAGNRVILGKNEMLFGKELTADRVNIIGDRDFSEWTPVIAKARYSHRPQPARARLEKGRLYLVFDEPQRALTPGQSVVLYNKDMLLGGGIIL